MNKKSRNGIIVGIIAFLAVVTLASSLYYTKENEYSVVKQFGEIKEVQEEAGIHFKTPFVQSVSTIPRTYILYDLASSDVITSDKKTMIADCYTIWRVTDATKFTQTLGASVGLAEQRLDAMVYNALKTTFSSMLQEDIIEARDSISKDIVSNLAETYKEYGIEVVTIDIKAIDLPDDNKQAVYERMISERNNIAAQYTAEGESEAQIIRNQTDKKVTIMLSEAEKEAETLIAEGEAAYMSILSEAYNDPDKAEFYTFVRSLDAAKNSLTNDENILILSPDSPLVDIFYNR
jgi:membrane protease subunit HflC